jgi:REP-associated tyrosine transposase
MTAPRQILPSVTYLVTRRCTQRQLLLLPSRVTNEVFAYVLALAARRYDVKIHAYCVLSNHYHLVLTDPHGQLPAFQRLLGGLVARALNASLGRSENFWSSTGYSGVTLAAPRDVVDKAAYTLANPVAAGLVRRGREWPGLWSAPADLGRVVKVPRPDHFFSRKGSLPESIDLELAVPTGFDSAADFRDALEGGLAEREAAAAQERPAFLGVERVLAQRPSATPAQEEPGGQLRPRVAARDKWRRIELLGRLKAFLESYQEALERWRAGERGTVFPAGTYWMRVVHDVACAGAG